jgi:hypothetical protein
MTKMMTPQDMLSFNQTTLSAVMKSGHIWATGFHDLSSAIASAAQAHMEHANSAWKAMRAAGSVGEAMVLQHQFQMASLKSAMAETGKLTSASIKLAEQTMAPISAHMAVVGKEGAAQADDATAG